MTRTAQQRDQLLDTHTAQIAALQAALTKETADRQLGDAAAATALTSLDDRVHALEAPVVVPPPVDPPPPTAGKVANVSTIAALLAAVADNTNDEVILRDGTYNVPASGLGYTNDDAFSSGRLWIGSSHRRTRPVLVRPETPYGAVIRSSGGAFSFMNGTCNQTWDGFVIDGGQITQTGCITFGGWPIPSAHDITLRRFRITSNVKGGGGTATLTDHAVYIAGGSDAPHDITLEVFDADCRGGLQGGIHLYKAPNVKRLTVKDFTIGGAQSALVLWESSIADVLFSDGLIQDSLLHALSYKYPGTNIRLVNVDSTGSGSTPLDAPNRSGLTIDPSCSFG